MTYYINYYAHIMSALKKTLYVVTVDVTVYTLYVQSYLSNRMHI